MRLFTFFLFLLCTVPAYAQQTEVVVDNGVVTTVRVTGQSIALMCESFVKEFGVAPDTGMISIKPKTLPYGQNERMGEVWIARLGNREIEVDAIELPTPLQHLKGPAARLALRGTCYTREMSFQSSRDIIFVTSNLADAQVLARVLRGE